MSTIPRFLITTADERTWKFDRPVLFLGEWCRLYDRRHIWQDMDAIVAAPYGLGQTKKDSDHTEARMMEDKLFLVLCEVLNQYHGLQHGKRFWRIILGHWLHRYVDVMLNRVKTLQQCLNVHQISGTTAYSYDHYSLATTDSNSAILAFNDDRWNNVLTLRILNLLGLDGCPVEVIACSAVEGFNYNDIVTIPPFKKKILKRGLNLLGKLASCLVRDNDAFIINSYLPKNEEVKLQLAFGQCPQLWVSKKLGMSENPDRVLRENLAQRIGSKSSNSLYDILTVMVFELLPVCFLEGLIHLKKLVENQSWPKNPKLIFTSNNFDTDEVFKMWAATKVESGIKYIIGQHGNNYGVTRHHLNPSNEEITSDKFLTWGWSNGMPQHTPAFIFKTVNAKAQLYNQKGGVLLIELHLSDRVTTWDGTAEHIDYFKAQGSFIRKLASKPKQNLTIRLHSASKNTKWSDQARWKAFDPELKVETGLVAICDLIANSRLVVHSYDSTGILETLSQNIPTLAFWQNGFDHLRESAKPYYQILVDAEIVHLTPESVAQKVNVVWDDVDGWWAQNKVQVARKKFCDRYAKVTNNPLTELKKIMLG